MHTLRVLPMCITKPMFRILTIGIPPSSSRGANLIISYTKGFFIHLLIIPPKQYNASSTPHSPSDRELKQPVRSLVTLSLPITASIIIIIKGNHRVFLSSKHLRPILFLSECILLSWKRVVRLALSVNQPNLMGRWSEHSLLGRTYNSPRLG